MENQDVTFWLSIASFVISGILAIIKLVEFFSANKIRIKADVSLTSLPEITALVGKWHEFREAMQDGVHLIKLMSRS